MKKVLIINEGYSNNLGDQAIKSSMIEYYQKKGYATSFLYFSNPTINNLPSYNYSNSSKIKYKKKIFIDKIKSYILFIYWFYKYKNHIKNNLTSNNYDIIVIGGGQLIISSGTFALSGFSIAMFWYTYLINHFSKAQLYIVGVGCSKRFNIIEKLLYKQSLKKCTKILVRDTFSKKIMKNIFQKNVMLMPDIAFYKSDLIIKKQIKKNIALIGIANYNEVFSRYNKTRKNTKEEYYKQITSTIQNYLKKDCELKLFYTTIPDAEECISLKKYLKEKQDMTIEILKIKNINDLIYFFNTAKYIYSGRMHALILGMKYGCKVKPFLISQKLISFNDECIKSTKTINFYQKTIENQLK